LKISHKLAEGRFEAGVPSLAAIRIPTLQTPPPLPSRWVNKENHVAASAAVDTEVGRVGSDHRILWVQFAQANQTNVGKVGLAIGVAEREFFQSV
jgi:hypothetical protein